MWQRPLRVVLALSVVAFAIVVGLGVRDRGAPVTTVALDGVDPDAILQSRGARITLGDGTVIKADQQFAYADGRSRLVAVDVDVPANDERGGLGIRGDEAAGSQDEGEWTLSGGVTIETDDGLTGTTEEATYVDGGGIVRMPMPARFEQGWMTLTGGISRYDRRRGVLHLDRHARVQLRTGNGDTVGETRIEADRALIVRADGYMRFEENVVIDADDRRMAGDEAIVTFDPDASRVDGLELAGGARIERGAATPGSLLRTLSAEVIAVSYVNGAVERAAVAGGGRVELYGPAGTPGATITGRTIDLSFGGGAASGGADELRARDGVTLDLPAVDGAARSIRAGELDLALGRSADQPTVVRFDDAVEFREAGEAESDERIVRAGRLEAALQESATRLDDARFDGAVVLEAGTVHGTADVATYAPGDASFILLTGGAGNPPRVEDRWGSIQGATVTILLDGPDIEATDAVRGTLQLDDDHDDTESGLMRPGLFDEGPPIYATAEQFVYDAGESSATYTGGARLWQGETEIRAETITLDDETGNLEAVQSVRTRTTIVRQNHESGEAEPANTVSRGSAFHYDNSARQVTYTGEAVLDTAGTELAADVIALRLSDDARTLEQIEASDDVRLALDGRRAAGATLAYEDGSGRYDITGTPVRIVEEMGGGCRETTGRAVTFYVTGDAVIVDGRAEGRTASSAGPCQEF